MSMISLYPSLAHIEQRLFAVPDDLLLRLAEGDPSVPAAVREAALADEDVLGRIASLREALDEAWPDSADAAEQQEPPALIKTLIEQKVAARQADFGRFPQRGQLVQLSALPTPPGVASDLQLATPLVVLLSWQNPEAKVWHGWLVAQEVQYAGFWDFLLQPEDEPFDPLCGMVQIWNPVQLFFSESSLAEPVGRLGEARIQAVEALALEYLLGDPVLPHSRPGFIAARAVGDGFVAVTGTPLGKDNDPRYEYQQIYHQVGAVLNAPVLAMQDGRQMASTEILSALFDVLAAAVRQATGCVPQRLPAVANAMGGYNDGNVMVVGLRDDLHLTVMFSNGKIDLTLVYRGNGQLAVRLVDDGEHACSSLLNADAPALDYRGLAPDADNHLFIEWAAGQTINLPVRLGS